MAGETEREKAREIGEDGMDNGARLRDVLQGTEKRERERGTERGRGERKRGREGERERMKE